MDQPKTRKRKTTETSFEIIETLIELNGASTSEIASEIGISPSTAYEHLFTLYDGGYITKENNLYYPGLKFTRIGGYAKNRRKAYTIAEKYTRQLSEELNWRSNFVIEEHGRGVFLHLSSGEQAEWKHEKVGNRQYLHNTATGKAILAHLPEDRCDEILDQWGLPETTSNTITERKELYKELEQIREQGYSVNYGENIKGIKVLAVPAIDHSDEVIGAFAVTLPSHVRENDWPSERFKNSVIGIVNEYELELSLS